MTAPEFTPVLASEFEEHEREYYTVQHKVAAGDGWHREIPPVESAEEAVAALEAHAHWYEPGHIRAVKKVVRTIVQVDTVELRVAS
jgi:hypothetical protein